MLTSVLEYPAAGHEMLLPVHVVERIETHRGTRLGAMHKTFLAYVNAGVVADPRCFEDYDIPGAKSCAVYLHSGAGLISA